MSIHAVQRGSYRRGQQPTLQAEVLPAPIGGIDGRSSLASNSVENCIYSFNMNPSEYGMRTREGYREWVIDIETAPGLGLGVRTIVPYVSFSGAFADDRLYAVTNEGIWNVSVAASPPVLEVAFAVQGDTAGYGNSVNYTSDAGETIIFYADSANGLFRYTALTDVWAPVTDITGVDPTKLVYVVEHKQRLWFVEDESTDGWYLPVGAQAGEAVKFTFGGKFTYGGQLVGLYNWSLDSGSGMDDVLVAIGRGGDVLPYQGSDPALAVSWELVGAFYVGDIPAGRRIASEYGGDLRIISGFGMVAMSDLLSGVSATGQAQSASLKIARFLREDISAYLNDPGWELRLYPSEGLLLINTPRRTDGTDIQYAINFSVADGAWGFWRGVPATTFANYQNHMMFGTKDNKVMRTDVTVDGVTIAEAKGDPIDFSVLHNFLHMGAPSVFKWGDFIRPNFLATQEPTYNVKFLYDYNLNEQLLASGPMIILSGSVWDVAIWDEAIWVSSDLNSYHTLVGGWGPGRTMAVAIRGASIARTTLVSTDVMWHAGGPL